MALRTIFWATLAVLLASMAWRYRPAEAVQGWLEPRGRPVPVVFDNGTVRDMAPAPPASGPILAPVAVHGMRKCQRGAEVSYTDSLCPKGFRELPIKGGSVTVVEAQPGAKSVGTAPRSKLRDALGMSGNDKLRDKAIDRVVDQ